MFNYRLRYNGLNLSNFFNFLLKNEIDIYNVEKINSREIEFSINVNNYKKYKKLKPIFNISIIKTGGILSILKYFLFKMGIIIGIIISIISASIINKLTLSINVIGSKIYVNDIKKYVSDFGIKIGKFNDFNNEDLEKYILEKNNNLSLVSVKKQGASIIINVVENNYNNVENLQPFYSPYNMLIKNIEVLSGTSYVNENDVIKKGSVIAEPYTISSNGERIEVPIKIKILADVWFCESEIVYKENIKYVKTGDKKEYKRIGFSQLNNLDILSPYDNYVTESNVINITNNNFLPIYLNKITFYKTEKIIDKFDFEKEKDLYFEKSNQKAYAIIPKNVTINETIQKVVELSDRYIFQTYLKSTMEINNET